MRGPISWFASLCRHFGGLILITLPLAGQSYQSHFTEPTYDVAKGPRQAFADAKVDAATGHLSYLMNLGPGIGARGAVYQPSMRMNRAATHLQVETLTTDAGKFPIREGCSLLSGDYQVGIGKCADDLNFSDKVTNLSGAYLFPGQLDLAVPSFSYTHQDRLTRFEVGGVSGVVADRAVLPGASTPLSQGAINPAAILSKFGYTGVQAGLAPGWTDMVRTPYLRLASGRYLVMALNGGTFQEQTKTENRYSGAKATPTSAILAFPGGMLIVDGDLAYEFTLAFPNREPATYQVSDQSGRYPAGL